MDGVPASPADGCGGVWRAKRRPARAAAGAVFLAALLAAGTGFSQTPPGAGEAPASPFIRQGTIQEEALPPAGQEAFPVPSFRGIDPEGAPAPAGREAAPAGDPALTPGPSLGRAPAAPAPFESGTGASTTASPGTPSAAPASREPDGSYELPPFAPAAGTAQPQREASMRLLQQGRTLLRVGEHAAALGRFEQAIGLDAANPYVHYFVARAHHFLENHDESLSFLEVAELRLGVDARWLAEVHVLRALNATARGFHGRADRNYLLALGLDPGHVFALARVTTIETPPGAPPAP